MTPVLLASLTCLSSGCSATTAETPSPASPPETGRAIEPVATPHEAATQPLPTLTDEQLDAYGLPYELIEGEPMFTVLEHDGIPSIDAPTFVTLDKAIEWMDMDETVLGVVGKDGTAKCYSAWLLDNHEIVNDELDGLAIAATW